VLALRLFLDRVVRDAASKVAANVSYNGRLWRPSGAREEISIG
jgi:hypothetical protein